MASKISHDWYFNCTHSFVEEENELVCEICYFKKAKPKEKEPTCPHTNTYLNEEFCYTCRDCSTVVSIPQPIFNPHYHVFYNPNPGSGNTSAFKGINYDRAAYQNRVIQATFDVNPLRPFSEEVCRLRESLLSRFSLKELHVALSTCKLKQEATAAGLSHLLHRGGTNKSVKALRTYIFCPDLSRLPNQELQRAAHHRLQFFNTYYGEVCRTYSKHPKGRGVTRTHFNLSFILPRIFRRLDPDNYPYYQFVFKQYRSTSSYKTALAKYLILADRYLKDGEEQYIQTWEEERDVSETGVKLFTSKE
mmetsp:Transcript_39998/g.103302  ORF Transcript_39998/g.103302 Transcript_39998/m.103302 type:complete len:305 (+) Transcript_39998:14927-15841(+)